VEHDVYVRISEPRDIEAIAEMNCAMGWETERIRLDRLTLLQGVQAVFEDRQRGFYVVAESEAHVVGCLLITFEWSDWRCGQFWWIQSLYVRPSFRRRGVFRQLHEFARTEASRRHEVCGLRLYVEQTNRVAQRAYEHMGMQARSYRMYEQALAENE